MGTETTAANSIEDSKNHSREYKTVKSRKPVDFEEPRPSSFHKRIEVPVAENVRKKKLTKLSRLNEDEDNESGEYQPHVDQGIVDEMQEEFFTGKIDNQRKTRGNLKRQKTQEELDEEYARMLNEEFYEGKRREPSPPPQPRRTERTRTYEEKKESEEDFFAPRRSHRNKANVVQNQTSKRVERALRKTKEERANDSSSPSNFSQFEASPEENYFDEPNPIEISDSEDDKPKQKKKVRKGTKKEDDFIVDDDNNFGYEGEEGNEDFELQRAIQASLEEFQGF